MLSLKEIASLDDDKLNSNKDEADKINSAGLPIDGLNSALILTGSAMLASCGGGASTHAGSSATSPPGLGAGSAGLAAGSAAGQSTPLGALPNQTLVSDFPATPTAAANFLMQASFGISTTQANSPQRAGRLSVSAAVVGEAAEVASPTTEAERLQTLGYSAWIAEQFAMPITETIWGRLVVKGFTDLSYRTTTKGFDPAIWRHLIVAPDVLRQRVALALSEILVVAIDGLLAVYWPQFSAAAYYDLLCKHCFSNYRDILQAVSTSPAMGLYLTFRGNKKFNAVTKSIPDENYAREIMQLFTIGLVELNIDGTPKLLNGKPKETYTQDDISGLARIFTGWDLDTDVINGVENTDTPGFVGRPMKQIASRHETGASTFLGSTVPAGLSGEEALTAALDIIFAHPNVAPFISKQLIQRLITSNPSPDYVARVATVFNNDGTGVKGNMKAVITAILMDGEARNEANLTNPQFGKIREPMIRFLIWARAFRVTSPGDNWFVGNLFDPNIRLGQSPLRSPTVFNFFRPGYVPPNSDIAKASLVAPELQITNEISVVSYVNFMQRVVSENTMSPYLNTINDTWDLTPDYSELMAVADDAIALMNKINFVMAANQLSITTLNNLSAAIATMPLGTNLARKNRIYAALTMVMAAPEFIVQK